MANTKFTPEDYARKVAGLLAKAEKAGTPEEAETFFAKAQELMTRYSVSEAEAEGARVTDDNPIEEIRIRIYWPYPQARAYILNAVADASDCRLVLCGQDDGRVVGFRRALERVQLLYTALSAYAAERMVGTPTPPGENTQSFRRSFMVAFGQRIGERLEEARAAVLSGEVGTSLVLADRSGLVQDHLRGLYPHLTSRRSAARSAAGRAAGRQAANNADLGQTRVGGQGQLA